MSQDKPQGGLLSKVVRFVKHPTVDWSELDAPQSPRPGTAMQQGRESVKAVLKAKSRNDLVREREFDRLRVLMRQRLAERAGAVGQGLDSRPGAAGSRAEGGAEAGTMEKIARIEAQMSRHWLQRDGSRPEPQLIIPAAEVPSQHDGGVTVPAHLQATLPAGLPGRDLSMVTTLPLGMLEREFAELVGATSPAALSPAALVTTPELEEAALRFANGDDAAAERGLRGLLAQQTGRPVLRLAWETLLDFSVATGRPAAFEPAALEFSALHRVQQPEWPAMPAAIELAPAWRCPPVLDLAAVQALAASLERSPECSLLDWSDLVSADMAAAHVLLQHAERWTGQELEFQFAGADVLRRRLKASTPSGRRENDPVWWQLRLALLRLMHRVDEFDLAALDFCLTYGELPPDWVEPRSGYRQADGLPAHGLAETGPALPVEPEAPVALEPIRPLATQLVGLDVLEWPSMASAAQPTESSLPALAGSVGIEPQLRGELRGDITPALQRLQAALERHPGGKPFVVDCRALARVDFAAAGSLLQWLLAVAARGAPPELGGVNRLVAIFFHVVGLDETARVRLREY